MGEEGVQSQVIDSLHSGKGGRYTRILVGGARGGGAAGAVVVVTSHN